MKKLILLTTILTSISFFSQEVKLKKGIATLDGKEIFTYEREDWGVFQIHFYDKETKDEVLFLKQNDNETHGYVQDDYYEIKFINLGKGLEVKNQKSWANFVEWLVKNKVINAEGKINEEKVNLLIENYDEKLSQKTVRFR